MYHRAAAVVECQPRVHGNFLISISLALADRQALHLVLSPETYSAYSEKIEGSGFSKQLNLLPELKVSMLAEPFCQVPPDCSALKEEGEQQQQQYMRCIRHLYNNCKVNETEVFIKLEAIVLDLGGDIPVKRQGLDEPMEPRQKATRTNWKTSTKVVEGAQREKLVAKILKQLFICLKAYQRTCKGNYVVLLHHDMADNTAIVGESSTMNGYSETLQLPGSFVGYLDMSDSRMRSALISARQGDPGIGALNLATQQTVVAQVIDIVVFDRKSR